MIRRNVCGVLTSTILLSASQAYATDLLTRTKVLRANSEHVYEHCKTMQALMKGDNLTDLDYLNAGICIGTITTVMVALQNNCEEGAGLRSNALNSLSKEENAPEIFLRYYSKNPQAPDTPAYFTIGEALAEHSPCPNQMETNDGVHRQLNQLEYVPLWEQQFLPKKDAEP